MDSTKDEAMDDELLEQLAQTLELLFSAGYFRAKIKGLSNFDKIVGGMVWCISQCAHRVDVDLLYSDNQTIGQKIAMTEQIVKVLPELSCPFSLEPHQIQGLDLEHIFPVVQWLVKEANFVRERLGNETLNFAVYQFGQQGWRFGEEMERIAHSWVHPLVKRLPRKVYRRVKRMDGAQRIYGENTGTDSAHDAAGTSTVACEYSSSDQKLTTDQNLVEGERLVVMEASADDGRHRRDDLMMMVYLEENTDHTEMQEDHPHAIEELNNELEELEVEEAKLVEAEANEAEHSAQLKTAFELLENDEREREKAYEAHNDETVEQLRTLLAQRDEIKSDDSAFKAQCRQNLAEMDAQIERLEQCGADDANIDENEATAAAKEQMLRDGIARARELTREVEATNRHIVRLSRRLGARPSQVELAQYQRKFVELCNQISAKHGETKRQYTLYNTLVIKRDFIQREINLLNSIDDQRELAQREEYRDSLLDNLQQIGRGVDDSLDKMLCKRRALQEQRDQLHNQLQMLLDKQRLYMKTVGEFQQACQRNEQLRNAFEGEQIQ
uniref:Coiled-coil domain-containing protein 93 n=1 Tax=Globodera pallida TaxID=36090 RepID=A0A183C1Z1_GLOPA